MAYKKKVKFPCPYCGTGFQKERPLRDHVKTVHSEKFEEFKLQKTK